MEVTKEVLKKSVVEQLGLIINEEMSKKRHLESNIAKKLRNAIFRAECMDEPERIKNIMRVTKTSLEKEAEMFIEIEEDALCESTMKQMEFLEKLMGDLG